MRRAAACARTQTLKNLVLGGIASFTVVDDAKCSAMDMGNNFMVGPSCLGEPRAKVRMALRYSWSAPAASVCTTSKNRRCRACALTGSLRPSSHCAL